MHCILTKEAQSTNYLETFTTLKINPLITVLRNIAMLLPAFLYSIRKEVQNAQIIKQVSLHNIQVK